MLISPFAQVLVRKLYALPLLDPSSEMSALLPLAQVLVQRDLKVATKVLGVYVRTSLGSFWGGIICLTSQVDPMSRHQC